MSRLLLAAGLIVGLLRFFRLGAWSLWIDEALTLSDALHGTEFANPIGYRLFGAFLGLFEGRPDEFALRALPAVFGWLAIPLTYWAFAPFAGRRPAATGALLVALSTWHLYWSQTARFYTLEVVLSLIGTGVLLRGLKRESVAHVVVGFLLAGSAGLAHPGGITLVPVLVVAPWILQLLGIPAPGTQVRNRRTLAVLALVGGLLALPWARDIWVRWQAVKGGGTPAHFVQTTGFYLTPLLGAGAFGGAVLAWRRRAPFDCFASLVVGLVLVGWTAISIFARAAAQYVIFLLPWVCVLAASPLGRGGKRSASGNGAGLGLLRLQGSYLLLLVIPFLADTALYFSVRGGDRPPWRDAYRYVWNNRRGDDLIMGMDAPAGEYYLAPERTEVRRQMVVTYLNREHPDWIDYWRRTERRTWFVVNVEQLEDWPWEQKRSFQALLREECRLVKSFPVHVIARDLDVDVYLRE